MKKPRLIFSYLALALWLPACSETPSALVDLEPALSVLSGAVQATQEFGLLARSTPKPSFWVPQAFDLFPKAWAAPQSCPAVNGSDPTTSYCDNETLVLFYDHCQNTNFGESGLWRMYTRLEFPSSADCTAVHASGFTPAVLASLVGKTVTRTYGMGPNGDQNNVRFAPSLAEAVYLYSDYPSGWHEDRTGGVQITFTSSTERKLDIKGVHVRSAIHPGYSENVDTDTLDLLTLTNAEVTSKARFIWDHTLNTVKAGDSIFEIGPAISANADAPGFAEEMSSDTTAPLDGYILVSGNRVKKGATIRAQHNIASGIGIMIVTEDLVWSDPSCCWPTSGTIRGESDRNFSSATLTETLQFTGDSCGSIEYVTITGTSDVNQLYHCF